MQCFKKTGKSLAQMSPDEKKKFFNSVDAAHTAKNEEWDLEEASRAADAKRDYAKDDKKGLKILSKRQTRKVSDASNAKEIEHIVPQLRKAITVGKEVQFQDGKTHKIAKHHAAKFMKKYMDSKPAPESRDAIVCPQFLRSLYETCINKRVSKKPKRRETCQVGEKRTIKRPQERLPYLKPLLLMVHLL